MGEGLAERTMRRRMLQAASTVAAELQNQLEATVRKVTELEASLGVALDGR
jgi:hypothetical protein